MKKRIVLYINTKLQNKIEVSLEIDGKKETIVKTSSVWTSQVLLPLIDEILRKNHLKITELCEVYVDTGPGSFTGVRVGVAVANALGYLLGIPVNGKKGKAAEPVY